MMNRQGEFTDIDFDQSSIMWRRNKKKINGYLTSCDKGMFEYCCGCKRTNGTPCKGPPVIKRKYKRIPEMLPTGWSPCRDHIKKIDKAEWNLDE